MQPNIRLCREAKKIKPQCRIGQALQKPEVGSEAWAIVDGKEEERKLQARRGFCSSCCALILSIGAAREG